MKKIYLTLTLLFSLLGVVSCEQKQDWDYPSLFWGFAVDGFPITQEVIQQLEEIAIAPEMIVFYLQWPSPSDKYLSVISSLDTIWQSKAVPCLTWEPKTSSDQIEKMIPYEDILDGQYDHYLTTMAAEIKSWKKPLIIRFAQEMNISRYHWGTKKEDFGPLSPEIYVKMFQYVVDLFKKQKADNVLWVFCPNVDSIPNEFWNKARRYYPGDKYVDILGMDGYNWNIDAELSASRHQSWTSPWHTFRQIFQPLYEELKTVNSQKPVIVFETASVNRPTDPKKSLWIQEALETSKKWDVKGIIWFQVNKEEDWRINQDGDYSYKLLFQQAKPTFQSWLLNYMSGLEVINRRAAVGAEETQRGEQG